jgi:sulfopyruvate decarboxylase TPP-binding subunit
MLITMRGEWAEFNPWQVPMGSIVEPVLKLCGTPIYRVTDANEVAETARGARSAFGSGLSVAVVLSQRLIGRNVWTR